MKKIILALIGSVLFLNAFSQKQDIYHKESKNIVLVPSKIKNDSTGTIQSFYISNEISNKEYREFTNYVLMHPTDSLCWTETNMETFCIKYSEIAKDMIDTAVWQKEIFAPKDLSELYRHYFYEKKFDNYPVVGVSYKQADLYCKWKTYIDDKSLKHKGAITAPFRLPTEEEWVYATSETTLDDMDKGNKNIMPVKSGVKNNFGLYHLLDNVSEWTSSNNKNEPNMKIIRGGSWKTKSNKKERIIMDENSKENYIGFRIVQTYLGNK